MALLMDDEDDDKHKHFNYDKIVEDQNLSKNKRKRLLKKDTAQEEDNFQVRESIGCWWVVWTHRIAALRKTIWYLTDLLCEKEYSKIR